MPGSNLNVAVTNLHGVGPAVSKRLAKLGITKIFHLLFHYPKRYQDFSQITLIEDIGIGDNITLAVTVKKIDQRRAWKRRNLSIVEAEVEDHTGSVKCIWFNQPYVVNQLPIGSSVFISGKVTKNSKHGISINAPIFEHVKSETTHTARIVPMYSLTHGITQKQMRYFVKQAIGLLQHEDEELPDWVPPSLLEEYDLMPIDSAVEQIHFPENDEAIETAKYRLGFNELLIIQLYVQSIKQEVALEDAPALKIDTTTLEEQMAKLPFTLTQAQQAALSDTLGDMTQPHPMNRLLEGDVGSGKTVVAALAMMNVVKNGFQATLMAPTALLAEQHYHSLTELLPADFNIALLTGNRKDAIHDANIIVGTHALIQDTVEFPNLALAIIDEQHRFGVKQRKQLKEHSGSGELTPHLLSMTATPIPRSLALTIYGDLSLSILNELPAGRKPISTQLHSDSPKELYKNVSSSLKADQQVYVVASRIEHNEEDLKLHAVETLFTEWEKAFPDHTVAMLHGKMKADEKQRIMEQFSAGTINILVSTTVIEVGVNVPNATCMVIYNAERFGLAQLHQLRGRVGRSDIQSYCYVLTESEQSHTQERLQLFANTTDGFELADHDLKTRGPGNVYGNTQSGFFNHFKMASIHNTELVETTRTAAEQLLEKIKEFPLVERRLNEFVKQIHLE